MAEFKVGVVGLGFGEHHVRTLANVAGLRLAAVADTVSERADRFSARYAVPGYTDALKMIDGEKLDALSLCVSPAFREPLLKAAADRGLPIFVEKPWSSTVEQGLRFKELTARTTVMLGFSFRFHPAVQRLRALLGSELGAPYLANGEYAFKFLPPPHAWLWDPANGNGLFNENSCHLFDVLCALMGKPASVMASGKSYAGSPSEDGAAVVLSFESGASAAVTIGGLASSAFRAFPRLDLMTEKGQARLSGREHIWESLSWALRDDEAVRSVVLPPESLGSTRYTKAFEHFAQCLRTGSAPEATVDDGIRSVALAEAVYRSIRTKRRVDMGEIWQG